MANSPAPKDGILLTHFIVSDDVERSRHFYADVLGGEVVREGEPTIVALANGWVTINVGGGPTDDKPTVTLANTDRTGSGQQLPQHPRVRHRDDLPGVERARRRVPDAARSTTAARSAATCATRTGT